MPTVIDELVIELNFDPKALTDNARKGIEELRKFEDAARRSGNSLEAEGKKTENFFNGLKREAMAAAAIFLGGRGVKEFFSYVTNLDAATGRLAKTMATATAEVSAWQGGVKQAGGTAEGASSALAGLSSEMSTFQLTGQSQMLPVLSRLGISLFDANKNLKTSSQLWLELSSAVEGMDPRTATAFLQMIPGANQDMIQFALLGRRTMESYIAASKAAGTTTRESAAAAQEYQRNIALLDQSATGLGRTLTNMLVPSISAVMGAMAKLFSSWQTQKDSPQGIEESTGQRDKLVKKFGSPRKFVNDLGSLFGMPGIGDRTYGPEGADEMDAARTALAGKLRADAMRKAATAADPTAGGPTMPGYTMSAAEVEKRIRASAIKRGFDPEIALERHQALPGFQRYDQLRPILLADQADLIEPTLQQIGADDELR